MLVVPVSFMIISRPLGRISLEKIWENENLKMIFETTLCIFDKLQYSLSNCVGSCHKQCPYQVWKAFQNISPVYMQTIPYSHENERTSYNFVNNKIWKFQMSFEDGWKWSFEFGVIVRVFHHSSPSGSIGKLYRMVISVSWNINIPRWLHESWSPSARMGFSIWNII